MATVVGSSYVSWELTAILVFFKKIFQNEPAPDKRAGFFILKK
jgi:hypothetical protein